MLSVDLLTLQQKQYISIPGQHENFEINCKGPLPLGVTHIYITSVLEKHINYKYKYIMLDYCLSERHMYCSNFWIDNVEYMIYGNNSAYHPNMPIDQKIYFSWSDSNNFCRKMGSELLYFISRDELDDFISILHGTDKIPYLEAVFIGLIHNNKNVSFYQIILKNKM